MKIKMFITAILAAGICMVNTITAGAADMINGAGATFPYPLYSAWSYEYANKTGIQINYQSIGSGGGVRQIVSRTVDFGASDDALKPKDIVKDNLLQWPQVIGGVVVIVNIAGIQSGQLVLDAAVISDIFLGVITKWNDPKIKALNPKLVLPAEAITVVHRADGSGTTAVFTHYLASAAPVWKEKVGSGKSVNWPAGIGAKGNEGVANYVKQVNNSIGYVEFAYAVQNKLTYTLLKNAAGKTVKPNLETFAEAAKSGNFDPKAHFYTWLTNAKGSNAWPITAATNILIAKDKLDRNKKTVKFFDWAFSQEADAIARNLIYAPLPAELKDTVRKYWKENGVY